ncbi:putative adenylate cyclase [Besnoitia besnoiti]|uniref:Putative adenylate cyclase n=1 Tax=Besnoitia besnoiti TaxID=94643 RepID=A0A2A9MCM1_BESBE|nr:putative adenylate cyclase [Besnoitia besnoiti]PFH35735.1 putative adenylate cyclase [Besnoitia besnoiti]
MAESTRERILGNLLQNVVSGAGGLVHAGWHGVQHAINPNGGSDDDGGLHGRKATQARLRLTPERPPPIEEAPETLANHGDAVSQDWRWLALRCEQRLNAVLQQRTVKQPKVADTLGPSFDIRQFACFMPRTVLEAIADKRIRYSDDFDIQIEQFTAAVVFCDASGFTALTEALDSKPNGAERLGNIINHFFDKIIKIVHYWGGDVIKFSGDAMTIVWPVDDEQSPTQEGDLSREASRRDEDGGDEFYKIDSKVACQLAVQCCLTLHQTLHGYATGCDDKVLTLHIGVGFGQVHILQVGGIMDRWEYVVAGSPLEEISIAEPLAGSGETVVSPSVAFALAGTADLEEVAKSPPGRTFYRVKGLHASAPEQAQSVAASLSRSSTRALLGLDGDVPGARPRGEAILPVQPPPPLAPIDVEPDDIDLLRRYIPPAVFRRLTSGCNVFLNELRVVSVMFVCVRGLDVSTRTGSLIAHKLMKMTQKAAYTMEGSVNKFLVDDKGVLLLVMFGLPPVYHLDDPIRATMAALRLIDGMKVLGLDAGIGITSGRVWCGTVGNDVRKEYTALGDYVNLAARLMGKAGPREIFVDVNTFQAARHALEFKQLPSMHVKGKEHPVQVFMPTGVLINQKKSVEDHPLLSWPRWSGKKQLRAMMLPAAPYLDQSALLGRGKKYDAFRPPLDYPVPSGPLFAHEWYEPFLPELQPLATVGGVMVIKGKEGLGTHELAKLLGQIGNRDLKRQMFFISNMPDSVQMNIGNVPLLAWRKLCTEMVERWRVSDNREKKGYSKIDRDNSVYGLTKELIHPSFHWRLEDMKPVIHGLVLPYELPENQRMLKQRLKNIKYYQKRHGGLRQHPMMLSPALNLILRPAEWVGDAAAAAAAAARNITPVSAFMTKLNMPIRDDDAASESEDSDDSTDGPPHLGLANVARGSGESIAPIIASLVNGFTLYESSIIVLHVRTGTSVFAEMDRESWKVARMVARVSLVRRAHRLENDMKDLKEWRRLHSRKCWWCKGYRTRAVVDSSGKVHLVQPSSLCRPLPSQFYQPLLFVLICSETTDNVPEQQQLVQMARDNNALIELKKLGLEETAEYLSHCLGIRKSGIDTGFVEYVQRASAGVPKYAYLTAKKLVTEQAVRLTPEGGVKRRSPLLPRGHRGSLRPAGDGDLNARAGEGGDSADDDGDDEDESQEDEEEDERKEEDEVARCVCELIEKVRVQREEMAKAAHHKSEGGESNEGTLVPEPNDRWTHSAVYDTLPPDARPPDASALARDAPAPTAFDAAVVDEHLMQHSNLYDRGLGQYGGGSLGADYVPSQLYLAAKYRERLHAGVSPETQASSPGASEASGGGWPAGGRAQGGGFLAPPEGPWGSPAAGRATPSLCDGVGKGLHTMHQGGGGRRKMGTAERQRLEDDARIARGKLTRAEFAFLQNAPSWVPLDDVDVRGLALYKKRRWAAARNLDWDSDAECAVEFASEDGAPFGDGYLMSDSQHGGTRRRKTPLYTGMVIKADLLSLPFVPELIANCMFTVERLQPEEQMVAKVASVFPCAFNPVELCRAYPRRKPLEEFCGIIYQLIIKDVLEVCDPPSLDDLASLAVSIGIDHEASEGDEAAKTDVRLSGSIDAKQLTLRLSQGSLYNPAKRLSNLLNAAPASAVGSGSAEDTSRQGGSGQQGSTLSPPRAAGAEASHSAASLTSSKAGSEKGSASPGTSEQRIRHQPARYSVVESQGLNLEDAPFPGLAPGHERRPSVMKAGGLVTPQRIVEGSLGGERATPADAAGRGAGGTVGRDRPGGVLSTAKAGGVVSRELWETVLMNEDGSDAFLRFNSIALQRVVSDLLLTDERKWLTLVCRRIIALRFAGSHEAPSKPSGHPSQGQPAAAAAGSLREDRDEDEASPRFVRASQFASGEDTIEEGDEEKADEDDEAVEAGIAGEQFPPQSLLDTALAAERETHEQAAKVEQEIAAKEQEEEIQRLVSKAVLSRGGSGHNIGRSLSCKGTATMTGPAGVVYPGVRARGDAEEGGPAACLAANEETQVASPSSRRGSGAEDGQTTVTNGHAKEPDLSE